MGSWRTSLDATGAHPRRMMPLRIRLLLLALVILLAACSGAAQLPPLPAGGVILAFGDSLTYGTGAAKGRSYPDDLARLSGHPVVNAGVPGEISAAGAARLPALLDQVQPALLILCHGGNDMLQGIDPGGTERHLRAMVGQARRRGIPVLLIGVPKPGLLLHTARIYTHVAQAMHVPLAGGILADILRQGDLKSDLVHPNAEGYRLLARALYALLRQKGALDPPA